MTDITPQSELRLFGNVPLDKGYKNCVYIGNYAGCVNDFVENQLMTFDHHLYTLTNYTYLRENRHVIRVKMKADDLWSVNYLCYKNPIMGGVKPNKWFFGFVDETVYVNNETTDIYFTPDIMTTWWEEANLPPCYVERMHEPHDEFGKNLMAEPITFGDYKYGIQGNSNLQLREILTDFRDTYTLVPICRENFWDTITDNVGRIGYDGVVNGYEVFVWHTEDILNPDHADHTSFCSWINNFWNLLTNGQKIQGFFTIPADLLDRYWDEEAQRWAVYTYPDHDGYDHLAAPVMNSQPISKNGYYLDQDCTLDGYLPANPKLYTAPFCTCEVLAPNGQSMILRHEYMTGVYSNYVTHEFNVQTAFRLLRNVYPPVSVLIRPSTGYASSAVSNSEFDANVQMEFSDFPVGSWTWGVFEKWIAQQFVPTLIDAGTMAASFSGAMNVSTNSVTTGINTTERYNKKGEVIGRTENKQAKDTTTTSNTGEVQGIKMASNFAKESYNWLTQVPASRGVNKSKGSYACAEAVIDVRCLCPNRNDAERIDNFLSKYGYTQGKVMQPMRNVREKWTYVQTNDCLVYGDMPSGLCFEISEIYNAGVTFWHNLSLVGRYDFTRGGNDCLDDPAI